jgi:carbamoyl-phosphate synthase large subunit
MPKRDDIHTILVIGSGPIVIGQGCEFDYSGAQACKALRDEGYRVVLVNSNPATIMTDPAIADRTYIEPIVTPRRWRRSSRRSGSRARRSTRCCRRWAGRPALNCACALHDAGVFERVRRRDDRGAAGTRSTRPRTARVQRGLPPGISLRTPDSGTANTLAEGGRISSRSGCPRSSGPRLRSAVGAGGIAYNSDEFDELVTRGINASMIGQVQVDKSLLGWKEYELEVVRDKARTTA